VHKGSLLRDGEWIPVAVKVLHPRVDRYIQADAALLEVVADWLQVNGGG
jgi:predicted unusual protein kinase regulating ubiquinone biosynthesis (AarF/ABC1/UbiB family)